MPSFDALILDGELRSSLTAVRCLGRSRYAVAVATRGFPSRHAQARVRLPHPTRALDRLTSALLDWLEQNPTDAVLAGSDSSVAALSAAREKLERITSPALAAPEALAIATSKERTLETAASLGVPVPAAQRVERADEVVALATSLGFPCVLKPDRSWRSEGAGGERVAAALLTNPESAARHAERLVRPGSSALIQEFVPGRNESITFLRHPGGVAARFAMVATRTWPPLGGNYVMRVSIAPPEDTLRHAERLVTEIGLDGYCEVEFRRAADGRPVLMEINARFTQSLELAVRSGIDFPGLQLEWARGGVLPEARPYRTGVRLSWFTGELALLVAGPVGLAGSRNAFFPSARAFVRDYVRPPRIDGVALSDPAPTLYAIGATLGAATRFAAKKLAASTRRAQAARRR